MNLTNELKISQELAIEAGKSIMEIYNNIEIQVEYKDDMSPLTIADKKANNIIVNKLADMFPDYSILSEESKDDRSRLHNPWCWIVDPLDGTKEFIKRNGEFTVNIALSCRHKPILGVIYVPVTKELYCAVKGQGAYYSENGSIQIQINVSARKKNPRLIMSRSHASEKLQALIKNNNIRDIKESGSSIKGCLIAKGEAEVYYRFNPTMEWDTAAMQCIIEEAGGSFRQLDGTEMLYNRENSLNEKGFYVLNTKENKLRY